KLLEELRMHLAWRWLTGLGFEQEIPHHSTFSKNRQGRFQESNLFQELFERMVEQCIARGSGGGRADVGRWQLHPGEREPPQSYPPRTVHGGSASELWGAKVPGRTRAGERRWRANPSARQGVDHRPGFDVPDQGKSRCRTGLLR